MVPSGPLIKSNMVAPERLAVCLEDSRIVSDCGAFGDACRNVAVMANGLRRSDAML